LDVPLQLSNSVIARPVEAPLKTRDRTYDLNQLSERYPRLVSRGFRRIHVAQEAAHLQYFIFVRDTLRSNDEL